jgi:hypothetical protein
MFRKLIEEQMDALMPEWAEIFRASVALEAVERSQATACVRRGNVVKVECRKRVFIWMCSTINRVSEMLFDNRLSSDVCERSPFD